MKSEPDRFQAYLTALARAERAERSGRGSKARSLRRAAARRLPRRRLRLADLEAIEQSS